jgi:hypothetical protein
MAGAEQVGHRYDAVVDRYEDIFFYVAEAGRCLVDYADPASDWRRKIHDPQRSARSRKARPVADT